MSREVDERIVQMQFDNAQFERNVQKSLKSLEELNDSLRMDGAEKGFEKIQNASEELDFTPTMTAVEKLGDKFSALEVMGITALTRLTNKVIDAGERMVQSLSTDNIRDGWNKYAQKTASVQTIVNATGKSVRKVNGYLDKLMWYADETSYGFTDMTASLGQLTAAGGDIDKVIPMIMGIANATAYAGKGASEFSRVIYNLNQSYSQGYLNLMDWKSVELAGVATAELKQLLIDTAVEQGKLAEGAVSIGTFGSTLSDKWADKEVMETAFGKLAEFTEAVEAAQEAYEAQGITRTVSQVIDELADQYDETAVKAFKAAQEAKSFTEVIESTKEAVGSKWLESFEIIFGNYEEAKNFWTDLANELYELFASGGGRRNSWLHDAFDSGLDKMMRDSDLGEDFENVLRSILVATGTLTEEGIEEAGGFDKALQESNVSAEELATTVAVMVGQLQELSAMSDEELAALSTDSQAIDRDAVEEQLALYTALYEEIQNGTVSLEEYAGQMGRLSGREQLFRGLLNILQGIESVVSPIGEAFGEVFLADGSGLYDLLEGFETLTGKLTVSEETAEKLRKTFKGAFSILNIGGKALGVTLKAAGKILEVVFALLSPGIDLLLTGTAALGDWLTALDEALGQAEDLGDVLEIVTSAVTELVKPLQEVWNGFWSFLHTGDLSEASRDFSAFGTVADAVTGTLEKLGPVGKVLTSVLGGLLGVIGGAGATAWNGLNGLLGGMGTDTEDFKQLTLSALEWIGDAVKALPQAAETALASFGATARDVFDVFANACNGARLALVEFFNLQNGVDIYRLLALVDVGALALAIWGVSKALKALNTSVKSALSNPLSDLLKSMKSAVDTWRSSHTANNFVTIAKSLSVSVALIAGSMWLLSTIEDPARVEQSLQCIFDAMLMLTLVFALISNIKMDGISAGKILATLTGMAVGIAAIGLAMNTIYGAVSSLGEMHVRALKNGMDAVSYLGAELAGMMAVLSICGTYFSMDFVGIGAGMLLAAGAVTIIANAVVKIVAAMTLMSNAAGNGGTLVLGGLGVALILAGVGTAVSMVTEAIAKIDWRGIALKTLAKVPEMLMAGGAMLTVTGSIALIATALLVLVEILKKLGTIQTQARNIVAAGMAILLIFTGVAGLSTTLAGIVQKTNWTGILEAAEASVLISASMVAMALAFKLVQEAIIGLDSGTVLSACTITMVGLMALLGVIQALPSNALGKLNDLTGIALRLSATLMILTPALKLLGLVSFAEAMTGVITLAGILAVLIGVGVLMGDFPQIAAGLTALSVALKKLAEAFSVFAGGALKTALFVGAFAILANFAGPICEAITTAAPDIQKALVTIVQVIANVLVESAPYLVTIITTLFAVLLDSIVGCIDYLWEGNGDGGIKLALDDLFGKIGDYIPQKISEVLTGSFLGIAPTEGLTWADVCFGEKGSPTRELFMPDDRVSDAWNSWFGAGKNLSEGLVEGVESQEKVLTEAGTKIATTVLEAERAGAEVHSPSKATFRDGVWIALGLANGLTSEEGLAAVRAGALTMVQAAQGTVQDTLGIHSPSTWFKDFVGFFSDLGYALGLTGNKDLVETASGEVVGSALSPMENAGEQSKQAGENVATDFLSGMGNIFNSDRYGDLYAKIQEGLNNSGLGDTLGNLTSIWTNKDDTTGTGTTTTTSTSKKTLAEQIEEEYKKKLEANKVLSDTVNEEYELWKAESQYSASSDELLARKAENAAANIQYQSERVAIAQKKYDEMTSKWGKDKNETKEARLDLLKEQTTLAELKAQQYIDIFEEVASRYDTDLDTLEKEYGLWTAQNENSASKTDKIQRETEYLTGELAIREKQLNNAQEQYDKLCTEVGNEDLRTKEAYNELLDAKTEYEETRTELAKQELELIEADIEAISTAQSMRSSRIDLLKTAFDDGELKNREDAYKSAVEQYGEDSKEAREARLQGTTSSIIGVVTALKDMNEQMRQTVLYQDELAKGLESGTLSKDDAQQLESSILSSQSAFLSYAGTLADSFGMEDAGKQAMLKLAYGVQKNWKTLSVGFNKALEKVEKKVPDFAAKFTEVFNTAFDEANIEIGAEIVSTITYTMQEDFANALASGLAAALDLVTFATSDTGKELLQNGGELATKLLGMLGIGTELTAEGGILGVLGGIGDAISYVIELCPELWAVVAVVAAIAGGIAGIVALVKKFKSSSGTSTDEGGVDFPTEYEKTIEAGASVIENAVKGLEETATEVALAAAQTIDAALGAEDEYSPCITPVIDLTNVWDGADAVESSFSGEKSMTLDSRTSTQMAGNITAKQNLQNGVATQSNAELLSAINGLGAHMDSVAENIKGMNVVVDGNKAIGYIDTKLGERARRR